MSDSDKQESLAPPDATAGDHGLAVVRGAIGAVPLAGGLLQEVFAAIVRTPLERRRERWMEAVGERLLRLEEIGVRINDLSNDDGFISVVLNATQAALRTHDETQLEALRNAVINSACPQAPDDAIQLQFVSLVEQLSGWHLRLLAYLGDPKANLPRNHPVLTTALRDIVPGVEAAIADLRGRRDLILQLYEELHARRLVSPRSPKVTSGAPALSKRTSLLGDALLNFVLRDPVPSPEDDSAQAGFGLPE